MSETRRSPARVLLVAAAVVLGLGILAALGGMFLLHTLLPTNYDLLLRNDTDSEITDVRLVVGDDGPGAREVAAFSRIAARGAVLAEGAGTGRFSLEYSDPRGRWIARRILWRDDDDCYGREPAEVVVTDGRVGDAAAQQLR